MNGPGIESRWGARFSAPVQTGPGAQPASCTVGTESFPGIKRPGRGADPHPHLQFRGLKNGRATPLPTLRALVAYEGGTFTFFTFTLTFTLSSTFMLAVFLTILHLFILHF